MLRLTIQLVILGCCMTASLTAQRSGEDQYVTGMTVIGGTDSSCPILIWKVQPGTPAANAGVQPGDRLLAIDRQRLTDISQMRLLLQAKGPKPISFEFIGKHGRYTVTITRITSSALYEKEGWKFGPNGTLFPKDATEAEMQRVSRISQEPPTIDKVFPIGHYPANLELYYPGFEIFTWKNSPMTVGGMEDGPAEKAGVHYGDPIVSVNGINPYGKSTAELERLFSSSKPAEMTLVINRDGEIKNFKFELAKASDIAALNKKRFYKGRMIPSVIPTCYLHCWER